MNLLFGEKKRSSPWRLKLMKKNHMFHGVMLDLFLLKMSKIDATMQMRKSKTLERFHQCYFFREEYFENRWADIPLQS